MQEPETREFPLADILSITTPRLLSMRAMQGVCDLVEWMLAMDPIPRMINLREWSRLKTAADIARRSLLRQHPQLRGVQPPPGLDQPDLLAWLHEQERLFGEHLTVRRATVEMEEIRNAIVGLGRVMTAWTQAVHIALEPTFKLLASLGQELRELAGQPADDQESEQDA